MQSFRLLSRHLLGRLLRYALEIVVLSAYGMLRGPDLLAQGNASLLPEAKLASQYFGADAPWFLARIPFLEIDDPEMQRVYYYRWAVWRSHIREIGAQRTDETEFLADVPWARQPYTDLNDSSSFHIMDGRWLRDPSYVSALVDHLYTGAGNDRHFSESIAAATYAWTQVTGDPAPALRHLDTMEHIYNMWDDHFNAARNLYWIEPLLDATEYTIASIDASGAGFFNPPPPNNTADGFSGGFAFRPSINSYQFANAQAIAALARLAGDTAAADSYTRRAETLRHATLAQLWNPALQHFTDIYQRSTAYVKEGTFIRGRELVGYLPWTFELPPQKYNIADAPDYAIAWRHVLRSSELAGAYGLRTVEPSYPRYLAQYRYDRATGGRECQWNGPSWPFQTSQVLTGLANLLHDYHQTVIGRADYLRLLRQYTHQHLLASGVPDIQEDYNPDTGKPIVGLPRSHNYNHSTYIDLIISGLIGIRPRSDNMLEVDPLLPAQGSLRDPIRYFALEGVLYHGHVLTIVYDKDGTRYHRGAGLSIFSDGQRIAGPGPVHRILVALPAAPVAMPLPPVDLAVNVWEHAPSAYEDQPVADASSSISGSGPYQAIDGRMWFFPQIANGWSPELSSTNPSGINRAQTWWAVDLRHPRRIASVKLYFFSDGQQYLAPKRLRLQQLTPDGWKDVAGVPPVEDIPLANGLSHLEFPAITAQHLRVVVDPPAGPANLRLIEFEAFGPQP